MMRHKHGILKNSALDSTVVTLRALSPLKQARKVCKGKLFQKILLYFHSQLSIVYKESELLRYIQTS